MRSLNSKKTLYFRDRCVNAYRMLKTGRFRLMWKSAWIEIDKRIRNLRVRLFSFSKYDSFFLKLDKRKTLPASYTPTTLVPANRITPRVDASALISELQSIRSTFEFQQRNDKK